MSKQKTATSGLLPYPVIVAATHGDVDAINTVLKHYEGYIIVLSMKRVRHDNGDSYFCPDGELRGVLEAKLITAILKFNVA